MRKGKLWKSLTAGLLTAALVSSNLVLSVSAEPSETVKQPEKKAAKVEVVQAEETHGDGGILPIPYDSKDYGLKGRVRKTRSMLPVKYDLRTSGLSTTVKDQGIWGSCWTFGTLSSLESNILLNQGASGSSEKSSPDYSEMQLGWFAYEPQTAASQVDNQAGEGLKFVGSGNRMNAGGNMLMSMAALSTWQGAADESDVPYQNKPNASVSAAKRELSKVHLQNANLLPDTSGLEDESLEEFAISLVKQEILDNGVIEMAYYADQATSDGAKDAEYFNYDNWAQYVDDYSILPNHSVSVVGWDDNYSKENFNAAHRPDKDGAWIVKNSWGTGWGENDSGYFYLSYYDQSITQIASFQGQPADSASYDNVYQYDYLGLSSELSTGETEVPTSVANVFAADNAEELKAVSAVTTAMECSVKVEIYKLNKGAVLPTQGTKVLEQTEVFPYAGYHTIDLNQPVSLNENDKFAVIETISEQYGGTTYYYTPYEIGTTFPISDSLGTAVCHSGESFMIQGNRIYSELSSGDKSVKFGNVMIKAFTANADPANVKSNLSRSAISAIPDQVYTGRAVTPALTVSYKGQKLTLNKDYTVKYGNNVRAGTASATITGMGSYKGTKTVNFKIRTAAAPSGLKMSGQSTSAVKLSWRVPSGVTGYQIYRSSYKNNSYKLIATVKNGRAGTYTNSRLRAGSLYKYKVRAYLTLNGKTVYSGWSNAIKAGTKIKTPSLKSAKAGRKSAKLKWSKVSGTTRYELYRSTNKKSWKKVAALKANKRTYTNKKLKSRRKYYYKIRAYKSIGGVKLYSGFSKVKKVKAK